LWGGIAKRQRAWLTPDTAGDGTVCRPLSIPNDIGYLAAVTGALSLLGEEWNWQAEGAVTPAEAAQAMRDMLYEYSIGECGAPAEETVGTPFWDTEDDVDDQEPVATQTWYGEVTNPEAPAGELDFVENVALWVVTGLVAIATFEVGGIAPALAFRTTVEKFIILQKRGDAVATIRFVVDGEDAKFVNTAPYAPGDIIETPIVTPQTGGEHTLLIVQTAGE
jgi:hypothetical protein